MCGFFSKINTRMLWKGVKVPCFARFLGYLKTALFAVLLTFFCLSDVFAVTCPSGKVPQTNVFANIQHCGVQNSFGYEHTGNSQTSSPISTGDGTWISYFPSFNVKGRAYCSTTAPGTAVAATSCSSIPRRPMADAINTNNSGTYCWCQATDHQQYSSVTHNWSTPFQKIYTKYVYLKDMGDACADSCAAYCSYMTGNLILDGSQDNPVIGENLRATVYDSLLECIPVENKITYISDGDTVDYQYYTGSVVLKDAIEKTDFHFVGWCETETCANPLSAGSTQNWSGQKTLYAQWERSSCETGVKYEDRNGVLTCTTECADGYEEQFNPFSAKYSWATNEVNYCAHTGNGGETPSNNTWKAYFGGIYIVSGTSYCSSTTAPTNNPAVYSSCSNAPLLPMLEKINTEETGDMCWCRVTGYEQKHTYSPLLPAGTILSLDGKYVLAGKVDSCAGIENSCSSVCSAMWKNIIFANNVNTSFLRISLYNSLKKCIKASYMLTYKDGDYTVNTLADYTVDDKINLFVPPEKPGFVFAGWCEDLNNCNEPMTGTKTGLFGNKTLYAKWIAKLSDIDYKADGVVLSKNTPTIYSIEHPVTLATPEVREDEVFEGWFDEDGDKIEYLPAPKHQTGTVKLYAQTAPRAASMSTGGSVITVPTPKTDEQCGPGYTTNTSSDAILDSTEAPTRIAHLGFNSSGRLIQQNWIPEIEDDSESWGNWGAYYADSYVSVIYGTSSCNGRSGATPPGNILYSVAANQEMASKDTSGANCWCKLSKLVPNGGDPIEISNQEEPTKAPWVYRKTFSGGNASSECTYYCARDCAVQVRNSQFFRAQVFGDYAMCKVRLYNIKYYDGDTEIDAESFEWPTQYSYEYQTVVIPDTIPEAISKEYYEFDGWCDIGMVNCSKNRTIPTGSSGDRDFYLRWKPIEYSINYNLTDGAVWPAPSVHPETYNIETNLTVPTPIRNGYTFKGWCVGATNNCSDEELQNPYQIVSGSHGDLVLWPNWQANVYNIIYKQMNGSQIEDITNLIDEPKTYTFNPDANGVGTSLPATVSREYYDFLHWHSEPNTNTDSIITEIAPGPNTYGDITVYAEMRAAEYNITYYYELADYNTDPKVPLSTERIAELNLPATYTYGITLTLPSLAREHYNFLGWYDVDDLDGAAITTISSGETGAKTLVAKWEPITYTITWYMEKSLTSDVYHTQTYNVEDAVINFPADPTLTQHEFSGWYNFDNDQQVTEINPANGGYWNLYAKWTRTSCDDGSYLQNGNCISCPANFPYSNGANAKTIEYCYAVCKASNLVYPYCAYNKPGTCRYYDYNNNSYLSDSGFCNSEFFLTSEHLEGSSLGVCNQDFFIQIYENHNTSFRACEVKIGECEDNYHLALNGKVCSPNTYTITYKNQDDQSLIEQDLSPSSYTFGVAVNLPEIVDNAHRPNHYFDGWYDADNIAVTRIESTDFGDKTFFAKWTPMPYEIEFLPGTAGTRTITGTMNNQPVSFNEENITLNDNAFSVYGGGYNFDHWSCAAIYPNGESYSHDYSDKGTITKYEFAGMMTCTAHWRAETYTLTYNCNGGNLASGKTETVPVDYDAEYELNNTICEKTHNSLTGWSCTNNLDTSLSTWNITDNSTCTASWDEATYTISYRESDDTVITGLLPTSYTSSQVLYVPTTVPTKEHFEFVAWCTDKGLTQDCEATQKVSVDMDDPTDGPRVFYAKWKPTACPAGQYLNSDTCLSCESGYTTNAWTATQETECYFDWNCNEECPDNATCSLVSGVSSGRIYYGSGDTYSCDMNIDCDRGYTKNTQSQCILDIYNINYHLNSGSWANEYENRPTSYDVTDSLITISNPERLGYTFDGWCKNADSCSSPIKNFTINPAMTLEDIDLYAQWSFSGCPSGYIKSGDTCVLEVFTITYMDGDMELYNLNGTKTFTVGDTIQLPSLYKDGYRFDGWCVNQETCSTVSMVRGTQADTWVGDKTLYAQWTDASIPQEFVCDSGRYLRIGNDKACLSTSKETSPAMTIDRNNRKYYLQMTRTPTNGEGLTINQDSNRRLKILYHGNMYNVHDASVGNN